MDIGHMQVDLLPGALVISYIIEEKTVKIRLYTIIPVAAINPRPCLGVTLDTRLNDRTEELEANTLKLVRIIVITMLKD